MHFQRHNAMSTFVSELTVEVSSWPQISVRTHRFGGTEFAVGAAEVGHVHDNGVVDIPFTRKIRDVLLEERLAEQHQWIPNSGWTTFRIRRAEDVRHACRLMRLSYVRYLLRTALNPDEVFETECQCLNMSPRLVALLCQTSPTLHPRSRFDRD
jgi:hypothetical protein